MTGYRVQSMSFTNKNLMAHPTANPTSSAIIKLRKN